MDGRGEAALRAERQLVERDVARRLVDPPLELVLALELGALEVMRPSTTVLPLGTKRSGAKSPERASSYSRKKPSTSSSLNRISATGS